MTTDAGINWQPWFAIREIYSNALDEGGTMVIADELKPKAGTTKIYVEMTPKLGDISKNWQSYFTMKREALDEIILNPDSSNPWKYRILAKREGQPEFRLFRRGILVATARNVNSLFDYDVSEVKINESRVVENDWEGRQRAAEALAQTTNPDVLNLFIKSWTQPTLEHEDRFWYYLFDNLYMGNKKFSPLWLELLKPYRLVPSDNTGFYGVTRSTIGLPPRLLKVLYEQFKDELNIEGMSKSHYIVTGDFPEAFENIHAILAKAGFNYPVEKIKTGKFRDFDVRACWDRDTGQIVLGQELSSSSDADKTAILLYEMLHAESGYSDHTREFQDYILSKLTSRIIGEQING